MTTLNTIIEEEKECPFCNREEMKKKALYDYGDCYVIEPLNPVVDGHLLVIPVRHIQDFSEDAIEAGRVMQVASLVAGLKGLEYNLITSKGKNATQSVFHLHLHLVPRKEDDGLLLPWTGTTAMQRAYEAGVQNTLTKVISTTNGQPGEIEYSQNPRDAFTTGWQQATAQYRTQVQSLLKEINH